MRIRPGVFACGALLVSSSFVAAPARSADECLSIGISGALGPHIFSDAFESGNLLAWGVPAPPSFALVATGDLAVEVTLDATVTGEHLLELRWRLPGGQLYQSVAVPFTDAAAVAGSTRAVPGYPFPVPQVAVRPAGESFAVGASIVASALPVAGTSIVETGLTGLWRLEAFLDGSETPCGAPVDFRLEN